MLRVISLGGGVQSTTLLLMALHGEFEHIPDCAIFADTGWEPEAVYKHLDWLESEVAGRFPIYRVHTDNILERTGKAKTEGGRFPSIPLYTVNNEGGRGQLRRQCTKEYKIEPIIAKERELLGLKPRQRAPQVARTYRMGRYLSG